MNSHELSAYKRKIIGRLISDARIVALLDPAGEFEYPDDLIYQRVFPFARIPDTEQEVKTYLTVVVDVPSIGKNDVMRDVTVVIRALTHESLMHVKGSDGDRIDLLSGYIDELMNESYDFGVGYVTLVYNKEYVLDSKHFYRELKFQTMSLNAPRYRSS